MAKKNKIDTLTIRGFQSIRELKNFSLSNVNVLIGPNGAGKSNFVSYFRMLGELVEQRLQVWVSKQGGADRILTYGVKETSQFESFVKFGLNGYKFILEPTSKGEFVFSEEQTFFDGPYYGKSWNSLGSGHSEAKLKDAYKRSQPGHVVDYCSGLSLRDWQTPECEAGATQPVNNR
jgi:hypothetical protein